MLIESFWVAIRKRVPLLLTLIALQMHTKNVIFVKN